MRRLRELRDSADAVQARAAIFRLWDECEEDEVGNEARDAIVAFVQEHLPAGPRGYGDEELSALNRERSSRAPFRPYGR